MGDGLTYERIEIIDFEIFFKHDSNTLSIKICIGILITAE